MGITVVSKDKSEKTWCFCSRCGQEIYQGEGYYVVLGRKICGTCLLPVAQAMMLPYRLIAGEEAQSL